MITKMCSDNTHPLEHNLRVVFIYHTKRNLSPDQQAKVAQPLSQPPILQYHALIPFRDMSLN